MSGPRPGFFRAFGPTFVRALRTALPPKKAGLLALALLIPPLVTLPVRDGAPYSRGTALVAIVVFLYLQLLVPLAGLLFATSILLDEESAGNLPYIFTRPAPRVSIVLARFAAYLLLGTCALAVSLAATLLLSRGADPPAGFGSRAVLAVLAAFPAYLAAFTFLASFTRWALVGGFLYAFGVELALGFIPGMLRKATVVFYSRSLLGEWYGRKVSAADLFGREGPTGTSQALAVLVAVAAIGLALSIWWIGRKQFVGRNPGRA